MTGTCTLEIMRAFERSLFGITTNLTHWPSHEEMRHRSVGIMLKYTGTPMNEIKKVIDATMKGPSTSASQKILIYSNMRDKTVKILKRWKNTWILMMFYFRFSESTYIFKHAR